MFSLSMVDKRGSFFECLLTLWALWSGSKTGTGTAVFVEDSSGSYFYKKKTFFFSGHSFAQKQLKKKFQLLFWERFRLPWQMAHGWESKRATCMGHRKTFSFVKLLHWLNIFETFCKKKKLLHGTQHFSFQNCFTNCYPFFVAFWPRLKKTRLFCSGNVAQNRQADARCFPP